MQGVLSLGWQAQPKLADFVVGKNQAIVSALAHWQGLLSAPPSDSPYRAICLWGAAGSGKTFLAQAVSLATGAAHLSPHSSLSDFETAAYSQAAVIDDIAALSMPQQIAAFALYNTLRQAGKPWLVTSPSAPAQLQSLRHDLQSRLAWGLVFELQSLSDEEKSLAMQHYATSLGFTLAPEAAQAMLIKLPRSMAALRRALQALDSHCLRQQKPASLHTVQRWLNDYLTQETYQP